MRDKLDHENYVFLLYCQIASTDDPMTHLREYDDVDHVDLSAGNDETRQALCGVNVDWDGGTGKVKCKGCWEEARIRGFLDE